VGLCAPAAHAYVAAQISEEIKPNFGILLRPPLYHHRHSGIWRGRRYGWGGGYEPYGRPYGPPGMPPPYGPGWDGNSITVDCTTAPPGSTPISDAAAWVRDGGVVYVRARGVACTEVIELDHPVVIAAEEASAFSTETEPQPVVIRPPDGQPCVLIAQGVPNVELRGLRFEAGKSGQASCVESWDTDLALTRVDVRYTGDSSAVYAAGGRLIIRESRITAHTDDAAVVADGAGVEMQQDRIKGDSIGLDLTLGPRENRLNHIGVLMNKGAPGAIGIAVHGERSGGSLLTVRNTVVDGYRVGIAFGRAGRGEVQNSRIIHTSLGVSVEGADVGVHQSVIGAARSGVYVTSGQGRVTNNRIYDLTDPLYAIYAEPGAGLVEDTNWFYLRPGCEHFRWDGRRYCREAREIPPWWDDETDFDRDVNDGWDVDAYETGYLRDGPVTAFDRPPPPCRPSFMHSCPAPRGGFGGPGGRGGPGPGPGIGPGRGGPPGAGPTIGRPSGPPPGIAY
jgi:hypothetical protein